MVYPGFLPRLLGILLLWSSGRGAAADFTVATYNLENYFVADTGSRAAKPAAARARVHQCLLALKADVLALQEIGGLEALRELQTALRRGGLDYPEAEMVCGYDTNIQVAVLSRYPIVARRPHEEERFLLHGRRYRVTRGFAEVDIAVSPRYRFTLITAHLKSRRDSPEAGQEEIREQEALRLRRLIDERLREDPSRNLVVLGDFNDLQDSLTLRTILGRGKTALVDTRPAERNGDDQPASDPRYPPRRVRWTHYYAKEDTYSRVDYLLLSPGMAREWVATSTYVLAVPNWGLASDHRPLVAGFSARDR